MIDEINTCLEETPFRCFCATFESAEQNPSKGIALFIYLRRIWPTSILDRLVRSRRIIAFILPVTKQIAGTHESTIVKVLHRSKTGKRKMRFHHFNAQAIFEEILYERIEVAQPKVKMPNIRPLRLVSLPNNPREWYE